MSSDQLGIREEVAAKVLVIDDEAPIRLLCRVNLEAEGMDVIEAEDGTVGVELARSERPDVILLDVMMPGMDGWEVLQALQAEQGTSKIPIVFLTARAELRDRAQGLELGGIDYVTKPFDPVGLAPLVHGLLERVERGEGEAIRQERIAALRDLLIE
jgi:DNA-binding response OmpR family regulator